MSVIHDINLKHIRLSDTNTRKHIDEVQLKGLADSIKQVGMFTPIIVRGKENDYEVVCGERRYRAAKIAKLKEISCIIRELSDEEAEDLRITENLQRQDISPLDEAEAYKQMVEHRNYTPLAIALRFGKSETYVRHRLKLNDLIEPFCDLLDKEVISLGHALELCKLSPGNQAAYYKSDFATWANTTWFKVPSVKTLSDTIKRQYTCQLSTATFDIRKAFDFALPCISCPNNSSYNTFLFPDMQDEGRCLDPICSNRKTEESLKEKIALVTEEQPDVTLIIPTYLGTDELIGVKNLKEEGFLVKEVPIYNLVSKPEPPEQEAIDMDSEDPDAIEDYKSQVKDYEDELEEYNKKMASGELRKGLMVAGRTKGETVYFEIDKDDKDGNDNGKNAKDDAIKELKEKDKRNQELQFEKGYMETVAMLKEQGYTRQTGPLSEQETNALMLVMLTHASTELKAEIGYKDFNQGKSKTKLEIVPNLTESQREQILRSFILYKLNTSSPSYQMDEANMLLTLARDQYYANSIDILDEQESRYQKRRLAIYERINELNLEQLKLPLDEVAQE